MYGGYGRQHRRNVDISSATMHAMQLSIGVFFIHHLHSTLPLILINVKNFHGSLTTVVRARNDTSKTANITFSILHGLGSRSVERFCVQRRNI